MRIPYLILYLCLFWKVTFTSHVLATPNNEIKPSLILGEEDRQAILASVSSKAMLPLFTKLGATSVQLNIDIIEFCENKTLAKLNGVRDSWTKSAEAWQQTDALLFGPSVDDNIDFSIYFLPIKKANIKTLLNNRNLTIKDIDLAGVGAQGFGALEYLLFSRDKSIAQIHQAFVNMPNNCNYLYKTSELLNQNITTISRQWQHYGTQFWLAGKNSLFFLESSEALNLLINKLYQSAQKISLKKTAFLDKTKPIKKSTSYKLPAWRSANSLKQIKANISGIKQILDKGGILEWMKQNNNEPLVLELERVMKRILEQTVLEDDLFTQLQKHPEDLQILVSNTHKLTELIKNQLAPVLGIALGFNDNDGD